MWGYAMGYIGGSTIPFVLSIVMLLVLGYSSSVAQKFAILITSVWWLVFSIPFLKNVKQIHYIERTGENTVSQTFRNIGRTAREIFQRKGLFLFVLAYFFYIDGVGTVISISTAYGTVLGLGTVGMILALLVTQIVAVPCSIWFSRLAAKITARKALMGSSVIAAWAFIWAFRWNPIRPVMSRRWRSITPSPWPRSQTRTRWRCGIHAPVSFRKTMRKSNCKPCGTK